MRSFSAARPSRVVARVLLLIASLAIAACGGGGGGGGGGGPSAPPAVSPPSGLSYAGPQTFPAGHEITALVPSVNGTVTSYSVSPSLPAGLTLNATNGQISGTPTAASPPIDYTITASNSGGSTTYSLSLTVIDVAVVSGSIRRLVASQTSIAIDVSIRPVEFEFADPLYATITDSAQFQSTVGVTSNGDGSYTLALDTSSDAPVAHHTSTVRIDLCRDAGCTDAQDVPWISVPFDCSSTAAPIMSMRGGSTTAARRGPMTSEAWIFHRRIRGP